MSKISLTLLDPGFGILVKTRGGAQSARIQFRGSKSVFDLEIRCMHWELCPTRQNQKKNSKKFRKWPRNRIFEIFFENFGHHENVRHSAKIQYFELYLFANILIFIVLIDSTKKTLGYRRSCGVTLENLEFFRFLRGPNGGFPQKISNFFFTKNCLTPK